ncbi:3-hydroxyacyl-ACP dehydratase FabZ [Bordetella genomosp. 4]|uniref:3-hydroxyacyl-[acyl-carrier-protein] dehydratase FabZ n=1 Tax=Bordetella genomosp. 4 TaxID=463044 RepID=A0A261U675_9BORD|nr:3-hydroxyacyl-ACP dehydratase FabZ [Bordetella genomosp. 4]OZI57409.1 3-hydroxyacyl-[acyl-carrier-protein] dehydratase FabZ [Bordetella genomosp. 4]
MDLDIKSIMGRLPHRYPMLLIDYVVEIVPRSKIAAIKNVSANDPFIAHGQCMPAVLIVEAMAQSAALFSFADEGDERRPEQGKAVYYFLGIDDARFLKPVVPGDQLCIEVKALRLSRAICKYHGQAFVDGQLVAEASILCAIRNSPELLASR